MTDAAIKGISLGLIIALMIGPVFFYILNTSLSRGFGAAAITAVGVLCSDAVLIAVSYFGSSFVLYLNEHKEAASLIGGGVIITYGAVLAVYTRRPPGADAPPPPARDSIAGLMTKGFMLNVLNPSVLLFWIVVASTVPARESFTRGEAFLFYSCTLATVLGTDLVKGYLASRLKPLLTPGLLRWMNRISGTVLVLYGLSMILRLLWD
jgi:threonine/homoserine/homoserine lactone efflux protein